MGRLKHRERSRNVTVTLTPADLRAAKAQARAEGTSLVGLLRARATERALNLDPLRALVTLIEARAAAGKLKPHELEGLRDVSAGIGAALASLAKAPARTA